jgi:catechol-2,3-dioxygenase
MRHHLLRLNAPDLSAAHTFYAETLGLPLLRHTDHEVAFQVGWSTLSFVVGHTQPNAAYHFAFNVPENQLELGKAWIGARTPVMVHEGQDTFYFDSWNAHAIYFDDPFGNVLELIARHNSPTASDAPFSIASLLCISEIGLPTADVLGDTARYCEMLNVNVFADTHYPEFTAVGDDEGLILVPKFGRLWSPETGLQARDLPVTLQVIVGDGRTVQVI